MCPGCWGQRTKIDGVRSIYRFDGTVRRAVHDLKYRSIKSLADPLAVLMADYLQRNKVPGDTLIAVPLHPKRLRQRGYNQSALLVWKLSKLTAIPVSEGSLLRVKDSLPQARTTNVDERRKNVKNAFSCQSSELRGKSLILIDDVCTSGATLEACGVALKKAGAISVWGFTLAREI